MVHIQIHCSNIELEMQKIEAIERSFGLALDRFEHVVRVIDITLRDVNGPRGGIDKQCQVQARLLPRGIIVARGMGTTFAEAANDACDKIRQAIVKRAHRQVRSPRKAMEFTYIQDGGYAN